MTDTQPDADVHHDPSRGSPRTSTQHVLGPGLYKRAYKACESCRKNKAKCEIDVGMVACVKCQREQRQCVFPAHRSSKRRKVSSMEEDNTIRVHERAPFTKRTPRLPPLPPPTDIDHVVVSQDSAQADGNLHSSLLQSAAATAPDNTVRRISAIGFSPQSASDLGRDVLQTAVTSSRDAMGLLFRAAAEEPDSLHDTDVEAERPRGSTTSPTGTSPEGDLRLCLPTEISPELVEIWNRHRFVRQGWFSPYEAIAYIEFFFQKLAPLSPVAEFFHLDRTHHRKFVYDEPLLCCTILSISARHMPLPGPTGVTHSAFIHNRLWKHVEHLIQRITFGTEKLGSAKSRTLGSIQALLLTIEWHPRSLHFPPDNDGWDASLGPTSDDAYQPKTRKPDAMDRWRDDVFEPAKRSDRMSWTLVGLATTLAHELGVFSSAEDDTTPNELEVFLCTRPRIRKLLYFFTTQLSLRLGCTNIFPRGDQITATLSSDPGTQHANQSRQKSGTSLTQWASITKLLNTATQMFFENTSVTRQIISNFRYQDMLEHYKPLLAKWREEFEGTACTATESASRQILLIEYHYVNVFVNSIAIQALVERINTQGVDDMWMQQDFLRRENAQDLHSIKVVRESSGEILDIATKLSNDGLLAFCPVRVFLRIVAASIFLLKALSLGAKEADATGSLHLLERCIEALMLGRSDDIHLSSRYADLLARHVRSFKRNFRSSRRPKLAEKTTTLGGSSTDLPRTIRGPNSLVVEQVQDHTVQTNAPTTFDAHTLFSDTAVTQESGVNYAQDTDPDTFDWLAQPFDPQFPPFSLEVSQPASGLAIDSLDFLWNL